jgi:phosphoribosylaminoimidazole carboxylase
LAARILGAFDPSVQAKVEAYAKSAKEENLDLKGTKLKNLGWEAYHNQMEKK